MLVKGAGLFPETHAHVSRLRFVVVCGRRLYPYHWGSLLWCRGNLMITPAPGNEPDECGSIDVTDALDARNKWFIKQNCLHLNSSGVGDTKSISSVPLLFFQFLHFWFSTEYHIHICQALSCVDTCPICMWFKTCKTCCCKTGNREYPYLTHE